MGGTKKAGRLVLALALLALLMPGWAAPAQAVEPAKELTEDERATLEKDATDLNDEAVRLYQDGKYDAAAELLERSLGTYRRLYPADKYPDGHPDLAFGLNNLGLVLKARGEFDRAEPNYREALGMYRRLYPADKYPDGCPDLAMSLNNLGMFLEARGEYVKAEPLVREALEMQRRLYPSDKYPDGCPDLARTLNNLGFVLQQQGEYGQAEPLLREALEMKTRLFPPDRYPDGHPSLAAGLDNLGRLLEARGEYGQAETFIRDALAMYKRLYPPEKYPDGHPDLATTLDRLGFLLQERGEYGKAEPYLRESLDMTKRLYPPDKYPGGHPSLAASLNELGFCLQARGEYAEATPVLAVGLGMLQRLYPPEAFPDGHPDLATGYGNLGVVLMVRGKYVEAESLLRKALAMYRRLYPLARYPDGHPDLAASLNNLGLVLRARGEYGKAEPMIRDALAMCQRLYPPERYPDGHPDLAHHLNNLGGLLCEQGEFGKAIDPLGRAAAMYDRLTVAFADRAAEAEVLNLASSLPGARSRLLAAAARVEGADPADTYAVLWRSKSLIARALARRHRLLRAAAAADEKTRTQLRNLLEVREDLARLILAPARPGDEGREQLLRDLSDRKERLEKELAAVLPPAERESPPGTELADRLPDHAAFVDLYRYSDWNPESREWDQERYAAFVLRKGRPVRRVELGDGEAIDKDLERWRQDIARGFAGDASGRLRKGVWEPIAGALGDGVETVYVCPDSALSAMPWPALPGDRDGHVLLEDYTFATVPSGLFLLEQLTRPVPADRDAGVLLALGGAAYDRAGAPAGKPWPALPATDRERAAVVAQARRLAHVPEIIDRTGADADVAHLLRDLPKARWAHLATHGFFAAEDAPEREHLFQPDDFSFGLNPFGGRLDRRGAAARNPLTQSGLVLAGANQPPDTDTGLLTGEAIAGLDLDGLDLAVLSACRTGLGEQSTGEGVFGLQRAFHIAGARNVVASLWSVDDDATAALMNLFYYHLWEKNEPPLEALHHAQLELYRNPQGMPALARGRGAADWDETVRVVTEPPADPKESPKRPAAVKDWAAFVLSGAGR